MNNIVAIVLIVILLLLLGIIIKIMFPSIKKLMDYVPKMVFVAFIVVILGIIILLIRFLIVNNPVGGTPVSLADMNTPDTVEEENGPFEKTDNCIFIENDHVYIDNKPVDLDYLNAYIDEKVDNNVEVLIVDDYALSSKYHEVVDLCKSKDLRIEEINIDSYYERK